MTGMAGNPRENRQIERQQNNNHRIETDETEDDRPPALSERAHRLLLYRREFVIDPEGDALYLWLGVVCVAVLYNIWSVIVRIAFYDMRHEFWPRVFFTIFDIVADVLYVLDTLLQFRMGYLEEGILVKDPLKLAEHYTRSRRIYFLLDVISASPLPSVFLLFSGVASCLHLPELTIAKDGIVYPILRLPKLLRYHTMSHYLSHWDMKTNNPNFLRACKLLVYLASTIHWIGCFYYIITEYEGHGINDWVLHTNQDLCFSRKYLLSIYWSTMTLTTIGDTHSPQTNIEYIFTGCTFLVGVFLFATVVGNVGDVISNMNASRVEFQQKMDGIKLYMKHHSIPLDIQSRVTKWAEYSWNRTRAMDDQSMLDILPFRLRAEIAKHVHLETLEKVKIFEECEKGLLCELVIRLRSQIYSPSDYICRKGEIGREMYIINHGKVEVIIPSTTGEGEGTVVASLSEGNYFGEISLLKLDDGCNRRNADVRSVGYSELLVLSKRDLMQALIEYPDARSTLERQARDRMAQNRLEQNLQVENPNLDPEDEDKKAEEIKLKAKEREMSELRHVLYELKAFDSQHTKSKLEDLQNKILTLELDLKKRNRELLRSKSRMTNLELQLANQVGKDNGLSKDILNDDGNNNGVTTGENFVNMSMDSFDGTRMCFSCSQVFSGSGDLCKDCDSIETAELLEEIKEEVDTADKQAESTESELCAQEKQPQDEGGTALIEYQTVSVIVPSIILNDTDVIQEQHSIQMELPVIKKKEPEQTPASVLRRRWRVGAIAARSFVPTPKSPSTDSVDESPVSSPSSPVSPVSPTNPEAKLSASEIRRRWRLGAIVARSFVPRIQISPVQPLVPLPSEDDDADTSKDMNSDLDSSAEDSDNLSD